MRSLFRVRQYPSYAFGPTVVTIAYCGSMACSKNSRAGISIGFGRLVDYKSEPVAYRCVKGICCCNNNDPIVLILFRAAACHDTGR